MSSESTLLWGGRFSGGPAAALTELSRSTDFDWRLAGYDLAGSRAHARALAAAGLLSDEELAQLLEALAQLQKLVESGEFQPDPHDEDVHTALERGLLEIAGAELGGKLRAGRSRNDQVATLLLMYLRDSAGQIRSLLLELVAALVSQAEAAGEAIMPGRTHLQHAQPVLVAHHLLAHAWPLLRDVERLDNLAQRNSRCPYGAGALAGNTLGLNAEPIATELGFTEPCLNSIDATAARDIAAEFLFVASVIGVNLSRLSEEFVIWNTREFSYVKLDDSYATGSSLMPQKKNPDVAELARGKSGRLIGNLTTLLTVLKGLAFAYSRDLQEDKEPVFDSIDALMVLLPAVTGMVSTAQFNYQKMRDSAPRGFALATDVAEWLVKQGVPFRQAHTIAGECVRFCEVKDIELWELNEADLVSISPHLNPGVLRVLSVDGSVRARDSIGGTAPRRVQQQLSQIRQRLQEMHRAPGD